MGHNSVLSFLYWYSGLWLLIIDNQAYGFIECPPLTDMAEKQTETSIQENGEGEPQSKKQKKTKGIARYTLWNVWQIQSKYVVNHPIWMSFLFPA